MVPSYTSTDAFSFDDFERRLTGFVHRLPGGFFQHVKQKLLQTECFSRGSSLELELTVDTNILFSEVRSLMLNNSSFLLAIADHPFIKLYAPQQIRTELYEKIEKKFPRERKTKNLDLIECKRKADLLLSKIRIMDEVSIAAYERARSQMEHLDKKDVAFLAVHFSVKSHGILTKDRKHFGEQKETRTWELAEAGQITSEIEKGSFSFYILTSTLPPAFDFLCGLVSSIWAIIIEVIEGFIKAFISILKGSIEGISRLPTEFWGIVGIGILCILLVDDLRQSAGNFLNQVWASLRKIIRELKEFFKAVWGLFGSTWEALKPFVQVSVGLFEYLATNSGRVIQQLDSLERARPK